MPRYRVVAEVTISIHTDVEAATEDAAIDLAYERPMMALCYLCGAAPGADQWVTSGEIDGDPSLPVEVLPLDEPARGDSQ